MLQSCHSTRVSAPGRCSFCKAKAFPTGEVRGSMAAKPGQGTDAGGGTGAVSCQCWGGGLPGMVVHLTHIHPHPAYGPCHRVLLAQLLEHDLLLGSRIRLPVTRTTQDPLRAPLPVRGSPGSTESMSAEATVASGPGFCSVSGPLNSTQHKLYTLSS